MSKLQAFRFFVKHASADALMPLIKSGKIKLSDTRTRALTPDHLTQLLPDEHAAIKIGFDRRSTTDHIQKAIDAVSGDVPLETLYNHKNTTPAQKSQIRQKVGVGETELQPIERKPAKLTGQLAQHGFNVKWHSQNNVTQMGHDGSTDFEVQRQKAIHGDDQYGNKWHAYTSPNRSDKRSQHGYEYLQVNRSKRMFMFLMNPLSSQFSKHDHKAHYGEVNCLACKREALFKHAKKNK